jgi:hypothetical protein
MQPVVAETLQLSNNMLHTSKHIIKSEKVYIYIYIYYHGESPTHLNQLRLWSTHNRNYRYMFKRLRDITSTTTKTRGTPSHHLNSQVIIPFRFVIAPSSFNFYNQSWTKLLHVFPGSSFLTTSLEYTHSKGNTLLEKLEIKRTYHLHMNILYICTNKVHQKI